MKLPSHRIILAQLLLASLALASSPIRAAEPNPLAGEGQPIQFGRAFDLPSAALRQTRRVNVLLPEGYDEPKRAHLRYPVLYLLDGGTGWQDFFHIAALVQQGGAWGANAPMIVVGVESKDRRAELTSPSSDPAEQKDFPTHGNAALFRRFLTEELQPAVRGAFRTDGVDGLIGESLAGLFVVETALVQPDAFSRYIAVSPSLWWDRQSLAKRAAALLKSPARPGRRLWLSMADEGGAMQAGLDRLLAALQAIPPGTLRWSYTPFPQERHATIYHPAATRAVREVFPPAEAAK